MQRPTALAALTLMGLFTGAACLEATTTQEDGHADEAHAALEIERAICVIQPTKDHSVEGVVRFTTLEDGQVRVEAEIAGLTPGANHGFHVHQYGDVTAEDGTSLGGHYNPEGHDHGLPESDTRHAGDLGNLVADDEGNASYSATFDNFTLGGMNAVIGRGMVVHAAPDDGGQPTGNAGARAGVGVIGVAQDS